MRIETNFTAPVQALAARVVAITWALALALAAATAVLGFEARRLEGETLEARERLADVEARRAEIGPHPPVPGAEKIAALKRRVSTVNALSVTNGRGPVALLALLEALLPRKAWLVSFVHKARDGEVVLVAEARQAELLTRFLLELEKSARFSEVLLLRQTPLGRGGRRTVQFELRLKERA